MQKVLRDSVTAELARTQEAKQYCVSELNTILADERQLIKMLRCTHEKVVYKDGAFMCEACHWVGWK